MPATKYQNKGFVFIELIIVITIIAVLAGVVIFVVQPSERLAKARDDQREVHLNTIWNAVRQKIYEDGDWDCGSVSIPATETSISSDESGCDLYACLVPAYLSELPLDPRQGYYNTEIDYDTGYTILQNSVTKRISLYAPHAELRTVYLGEAPAE